MCVQSQCNSNNRLALLKSNFDNAIIEPRHPSLRLRMHTRIHSICCMLRKQMVSRTHAYNVETRRNDCVRFASLIASLLWRKERNVKREFIQYTTINQQPYLNRTAFEMHALVVLRLRLTTIRKIAKSNQLLILTINRILRVVCVYVNINNSHSFRHLFPASFLTIARELRARVG